VTTTNPEKIGRYQIVERVGRGGMGVLYRGIDAVLDREVAIKVMLLDFSDDEEQLRARFYREARAIAKLQHRNIVTVFEFADDGTTPYIVMEFLRGSSLAARIKSPLPLALEDKLNIVAQLCDALHYAHEQELVHRDVKPANVFLLADGSVKLLDFGIAKVATSTLTRTSDLLGSVSYMSPEQVSGNSSVDGRSDIFSTGVLLYELLAGRTPFDSEVPTATIVKILHEPPPPLNELVPGLPAQLVAAVNRSLAKKPEDRYATADEFGTALQAVRKALMAAGESQGLEETRFASHTEVQALLNTPAPAPAAPEGAAAAGAVVAASRTKAWPVAAGIGVVVLIGAILATVAIGRGRPSTAAAPAPVAALPATSPATAAAPRTAAVVPASAGAVDMRIESTPAGATITLDGQNTRQTTPASITLTGAEPHRLRLAKRGFVAQDVTLVDADLRRGAIAYALVPAAATTVPVSITSTYPVEVFSGERSISGAAESHKLTVGVGATVHITSPQYHLDASFKVEDKPIDFQAPALGYLTVLTKYETCKVKVGPTDLGYPPITKLPIAAGQHRVDIACANGTAPPGQLVTILPNNTATARIY
jgi:hypothetical protein